MSTNTAFLRIPAIGLLIATLAACGELPSAVVLDQPPREPPSFPPAPGAVAIYERIGEHSFPAGVRSRYVFYNNGAFGLQYLRGWSGRSSVNEYAGTRSQADSVVTFSFHGDGRWFATGTMRGDTLIVEYTTHMMLDGFEDGVYLLSDETPVSPVAIYERSGEHSWGGRSRYVFYDNEAFVLQRLQAWPGRSSLHEYAGTRSQADSVITFSFHGDSRWLATGTMRGDTLIVQYNTVTEFSVFEDGVYLLSPEDN